MVVAMVMLASVTFISFALSSIIIREIMAARLVLRSEPAISGANAGGEVGLYQLLRETGVIDTSGSMVETNVTYQVSTQLFDNAYAFSIPALGVINVALYDPTNPNNPDAGYGTVTVYNNPGSDPIKVEVYSWANLETPICPSGGATPAGGTYTCPSYGTLSESDDRYLIKIEPTGSHSASGIIQTTDESYQPKGVPADSPELKITGQNGDVRRRIEIKLQ